MGMDVYGRKPKNKKGEYFRNNVWFWHPLWDYCLKMYPKVTSKCKEGHSNSGDGLNASDSKKLAALIRKDLDNGNAALYAEKYREWQNSLEKEQCTICNGSGKRLIKSKLSDSSEQEIEEERICNGCNGEGKRDSWYTNYPFTLENLTEWQEFLDNCGGFNIY
jgi:hypothetical protein